MRRIDLFAGVNLLLFIVLAVFRYYARFIEYRGAEHLEEFFIYAVVILAFIVALWRIFRRHDFDTALLVLVQIGILMHFAGAFVPVDGGRLYDWHLLGVRYDKYVHFVNAFAATFLINRLFSIQGIAPTLANTIFLVLITLGLGAVVEIVEYVALLTVPNSLVGNYDNNMVDLIANLCGSLSFIPVRARFGRGFG
ncbi:MAG: hypothetical protein HOP28_01365 [Gemmatimonadales bacterium]|nr:hypothetical protein [Gemmatimonadales bacterium]